MESGLESSPVETSDWWGADLTIPPAGDEEESWWDLTTYWL